MQHGDAQMKMLFLERKSDISKREFMHVIRAGTLEMIEIVSSRKNHHPQELIFEFSCEVGREDVIKWYIDNNYSLSESVVDNALKTCCKEFLPKLHELLPRP